MPAADEQQLISEAKNGSREAFRCLVERHMKQAYTIAYGLWVACHWVPCAAFLAQASWELHANFRSLAAAPRVLPWWRRLWRFLVEAKSDFTV